LQLTGHRKDLGGGFLVSRLLPSVACRAVGPFVFVDLFGPTVIPPAMNIDVRPHPHIGLATVSYLFEGALMHRDSLGSVQRIDPGAINWMSAGRGIVHSERTPEDLRDTSRPLHGLQLWVALPQALEESGPAFQHTSAEHLPRTTLPGAQARVLVGEAFGERSPVGTASPTLLVDLQLASASVCELPALAEEVGLLPIDADLEIDGQRVPRGALVILGAGEGARLRGGRGERVIALGGQRLDGPRHLWWNFVSSSKERIRQAAEDWKMQRFDRVPGETEFIPGPEYDPER